MKTPNQLFRSLLILTALLVISGCVSAQDKKTEIIKIKTSAMCGQCKERIEGGLAYEKGVKDVQLDIETKIVTIKFNTKTTTPDELRKKIAKLGYDADDIPADKASYSKLPPCCKKDASKH